jgi:hypothetical protein
MSANDSVMKLANKDEFLNSLLGVEEDVQAAVIVALSGVAKTVAQGVKDDFPEAQHVANMSSEDTVTAIRSTAGNIPMVQTGELRDSLKGWVMPVMLGEAISAKIALCKYAFYGHILEFGSTKMAARPWFFKSVLARIPSAKPAILEALGAVIERRNSLRGGYIRRGRMTSAVALTQYNNDISMLGSL